jgi:hypothetical protein
MSIRMDDPGPVPRTESVRTPEPGTIIEPYIRMFGGRYRTASIMAGVVLFLVGLGIAIIIGFHREYVTSRPIYLGVCGVTWATWWVAWGARRTRVLTERVRPIFLDPPGPLQSDVARFEKWVFNWPLQARIALVLWVVGCLDIYVRIRKDSLFVMPEAWSKGPYLPGKMLILFVYDLPVVTLFTASGISIISFVLFVRRITQHPLLPYLTFARVKLQGLTEFSVVTGLAWSVGICLVVLLFDLEFTALSVASILVYSALGLAILFVPEISVHNALERTRHEVLDEAIRRLKDPGKPSGHPAWLQVLEQSPDAEKAFDRAVQEALRTSTWTYDVSTVSSIVGTWLLPLVPLLANSIRFQWP